jgi:hypothetical protein
LGFRIGDGPDAKAEQLVELSVLSNQTHFTTNSITYPDSIDSIGRPNTIATNAFRERGPFDVVNLDVCGGILHGDPAPLLNAIKYILDSQVQRPLPWLLFVTTTAKAEHIAADVITKFFSMVTKNCEKVAAFNGLFTEIAAKNLGMSAPECLKNPAGLHQDGFLRFFTLAFGKWLLANLSTNNPRSNVTLRSVYTFRNTERDEPEMLSLAYLVSPVIGGGADPSGLTAPGIATPEVEYADGAVQLIAASIEGVQDLDQVWQMKAESKLQIVSECEDLLKAIGVDDDGLAAWRTRHGLGGILMQRDEVCGP